MKRFFKLNESYFLIEDISVMMEDRESIKIYMRGCEKPFTLGKPGTFTLEKLVNEMEKFTHNQKFSNKLQKILQNEENGETADQNEK